MKLDIQGEGGERILDLDRQGGGGSWKSDNFHGRHIYIIPKQIILNVIKLVNTTYKENYWK